MPLSQTVLLNRADIPSHSALESTLKELQFKLSVDAAYEPLKSSGYLPCTLNGEDGGVQIRFEQLSDYAKEFPDVAGDAGSRDIAIRLRAGGDPREEVCVLMIASALARSAGALIHDARKQVMVPATDLASQALARFQELD